MDNDEGPSYTKLALQGFFVATISALMLNCLGAKLQKFVSSWFNSDIQISEAESNEIKEKYNQKKRDVVDGLQKRHQEKALDYNERILIPRAEEKLRKKMEKLDKFSGPAWKGQGHVSGYMEVDNQVASEITESTYEAAARRRNLIPDTEAKANTESNVKKTAKKHVIKLPDEPESEGPNVVTIVFRTPIGTTCQRRFFSHNLVQTILDFVTTKGFSQSMYCLATSYPRVILDDSTIQLSELKLGTRFVLNIEDKE